MNYGLWLIVPVAIYLSICAGLLKVQVVGSTITDIRDLRIEALKKILGRAPVQGLDAPYPLLTLSSETLNNLESVESIRQYATIIASAFGPLALPYSLDYTLPPNFNSTYDYVIIGAGSAGSTLAARLTEDSSVKVLVIEAGGLENNFSVTPVLAFLQQKTSKDWLYESTPQTRSAFGLNGNRIPAPRGKVVGGGSAINYLLYVRGNKRDFDRWEELGATGWNHSSISPYFLKAEGLRDTEGDPGYHGYDGPLTVTPVSQPFEVDTAFLEGCAQYNLTLGDYNGAQQESWQYSRFTIRDGIRCSTGLAYLSPASKRSNLHVLLFSRVTRILFDDNKVAIGVEFTKGGQTFQVFVRREVILSAGAFNSPQILMLSGIGPREELNKFNIPIVHESPGVGSGLKEHPFTILFYTTRFGSSLVLPRVDTIASLAKYELKHEGQFATPGLDVIGFWRSKYAIDERPDIQIHQLATIFGGGFPNLILGNIFNLNTDILLRYLSPYALSDGTMFLVTQVRPRSVGSVRLSSSDPRDAPIIDLNLFDDERDLQSMVEGCKLILNISMTPAMKAVDAKRFSAELGDCSQFPLDSDPYLKCLVQTLTFTLYHPTSTAKIGSPDDPMAVVDPNLRVYGVKNLRVIDASVMPEVSTGNTNAPTIAVAERAADLIKGRQLRPRALPIYDKSALDDYVSI